MVNKVPTLKAITCFNGEIIDVSTHEFLPYTNLVLEADVTLEEQYQLDPSNHLWVTDDGEEIWVNYRSVPYPEYCEESGRRIPEDAPVIEARGEVYDRRIAQDPILRPMYRFYDEESRDQFLATTMQRRYGDAPPKVEIELHYEEYDRFARVFVDGVEIYTVQGAEGINLDHDLNSIPTVQLSITFTEYKFSGRVMGPGNLS